MTIRSTSRARPPAALSLELPATPESVGKARRAVRSWAEHHAPTIGERDGIMLAVSEAASNAVRHAYPEGRSGCEFRVHARVDADRLLVAVEDDGVGLDARSRQPGLGVGIPLISQLTAAVRLASPPDRQRGCEVRMWFALESLARRQGPRIRL